MGNLYVVPTPIGNIGDISERVKQTLSDVDFIVAEDTRNSGILLNILGIKKPLVSYHKFNEKERASSIIKRIQEGNSCALVTDAGTPCISDPGSILVKECYEAGIKVIGLPGPSAVVLALSICGFEVDDFAFYGFFPRNNTEREQFLMRIKNDSTRCAVVYESPKRIEEFLNSVQKVLHSCNLCLCNDLTKKFERIYRGSPSEVLSEIKQNEKSELGEYAIVLSVPKEAQKEEGALVSIEARLFDKIIQGMDSKSAVKALQEEGVSRNEAYEASLNVKKYLK